MRHKYQCLECSHMFNGHPIKIDGTRCPLCNGPTAPCGPADPALDKNVEVSKFKVTVDITGTELFTRLLEVLRHAAETTACEATRVYIIKQVDLIEAEHSNMTT